MNKIEKKWQKKWEKAKIFQVKEKGKKFYCLEMFPYPSGSGLHMGHAFNYTIGDIYARFKKMNGFNVLHPMGYDAFGLPAENAAIKEGEHPKKYTEKAIENFIEQQKALGLSYDWSRSLRTCDPQYYKWNQYFFLKLLENNLVYRKKAAVNWCPKCETALANEQVHSGKCWRHKDTDVEIKYLEQWFIKITKYADELVEEVKKLSWPERIKIMQKNWIGRSHGTEINFKINNREWPIFTTRPDTIYGVTFLVVSAQHPKLMDLVTKEQREEVESFLRKIKSTSEKEVLEKEGAFTGSYAVNPLTREKVPVYAGNFVVAEYGSGMVMAVPAHDQRDFEFAKKYDIPIKIVIQNKDKSLKEDMKEAYTEEGVLVNSGEFNGIKSKEAIEKISTYIQKRNFGKRTVEYKLRDWLISRQRYWGTPIPVVYCSKCGIVPEKNLPVKLPEKIEFGKGNPLLTNKKFINVKCPKCKSKARRETDTMDTFFDSSWYFLRYTDPKNSKLPFDRKKLDYWMPVDQYVGGAEHACMHLIYARFFVKALRDLKYANIDEPFTSLFNQGMLHGSDGFVMSKSRGNVINPLTIIEKYSADVLRFYLVSNASPDKDFAWSDQAIEGSNKFLKKIMDYFNNVKIKSTSEKIESRLNKAIKEVTEDISSFRYNLAVIKIRDLVDNLEPEISKKDLESFLKLLHPICPHITEELWEKIGNKPFISLQKWPIADEKKINKKFEEEEKLVEQLVSDVNNILRILKEKPGAKVYVYVLPKELEIYGEAKESVSKKINKPLEIFAVNDKNKYDPQNKARKAKPNRPAIYIE